jgi:hypothetical protein
MTTSTLDTREILLSLLAIAVDERENRAATDESLAKTELVLAKAGLDAPAIAELLGKKTKTVAQTIRRSSS